jgi:Aspartyl protease/PDZ domain
MGIRHLALGSVVLLMLLIAATSGSSLAKEMSGASPLPDAAQRYLAWRGGRHFRGLRSVSESGRVIDGGLPGVFERFLDREGDYWLHEDLGVVHSSEAADRTRGWRTTLSGQVQPLSPPEAIAERREAALMFAGVFEGELGAHVSSAPDEVYDGHMLKVFHIRFQGPDSYDFLVDSSGALAAIRMTEDHRPRIVRFGGWHLIDNVEEPTRLAVLAGNEASQAQFTIESSHPNAALSHTRFLPPASALHMTFSGRSDWSGWLDFRLFDHRRIYVPAVVNGAAVQMLLDSGAEATVLNPAIARAVRAQAMGKLGVEGAGGSSSAAIVTDVSVRLGRLTVTNLTALTMDLSRIGKDVGIPLQAILGQEVFNELIVDIDFVHHRLCFRDPQHFVPPPGARRLTALRMNGNRVIEVSVEGKSPIPVVFDLGNGSPLDLFPSYWKAQRLLEGRPQSRALMGGAGGEQDITVATMRTVRLAGETFRDVPVNFAVQASTTENSERVKGNVGLPLLSRFRVITDFEKNALFLIPNASDMHEAFQKDRSGLTVEQDKGELVVTFVAPHSPAAEAGWKVGDKIVAVDGRPISALEPLAPQTEWRYGGSGTRVSLLLANGETRKLQLRDYY